ncbi:zinc finger protein 664-like [Hydractinia symbiolongicarpus]|uniref:zinc finger protein 664-like n=1 Tax=Hydractinia symbiolongicarpus TaxID=13093 RepID=UPI00254D5A6C|nr:zinc finger protein 664-like [Hydractinia symbiolongicarpus]
MNGTTEKNTCSNDADAEIQLEYYEDYDDSSSVIKEEDFATVCCDFTENDSQNEEYRRINDIDTPVIKPSELDLDKDGCKVNQDLSRCTMVYIMANPYQHLYQPRMYRGTTVRRNEMLRPVEFGAVNNDENNNEFQQVITSPITKMKQMTQSKEQREFLEEICYGNDADDENGDIDDMFASMTRHKGGYKQLKCPFCKKASTTPGNLKRHMRIHTGEKPYHCDECNLNFTRLTDLKRHALSHAGMKLYKCQKCGKGFSLKGNLVHHYKNDCEVNEEYQCSRCDEQFYSIDRLNLHKKTSCSERVNECKECGKRFSQAGNLKRHMRTHTGEKPYACTVCGKGFAGTSDLKRHQLIHTGEKPYICRICDRGFRIKCNLTIHERIHTGEKPFKCNECGATFRTSSNLYAHIRKHELAKPEEESMYTTNKILV